MKNLCRLNLHFVECGTGWSKWYYGLRLVIRGHEIFRIKLWENADHWSYKLKGKSK